MSTSYVLWRFEIPVHVHCIIAFHPPCIYTKSSPPLRPLLTSTSLNVNSNLYLQTRSQLFTTLRTSTMSYGNNNNDNQWNNDPNNFSNSGRQGGAGAQNGESHAP